MSYQHSRRKTHTITIGSLKLGSDYPIVSQSMTTSDTNDTAGCVEQILKVYEAGGSLVRLTAANKSQAHNLKNIHHKLQQELISMGKQIELPLCADIHFNSELALIAAQYVEKVRINPGNYGSQDNYRTKFVELINLCKLKGRAIRIGVNHGSLSKEIMELYGDTPLGMVQSALQYLRVCKEEYFGNAIVSLKSSNVRVMVESYRLASKLMLEEDLTYPFHLGVTESGEGDSGRIRSAVGIGALLADGIGDTIRVSLTEPPQNEIPVAQALIEHYREFTSSYDNSVTIDNDSNSSQYKEPLLLFDYYNYKRRKPSVTPIVVGVGGDYEQTPDSWFRVSLEDITKGILAEDMISLIKSRAEDKVVIYSHNTNNWVGDIRATISYLVKAGVENDFVLYRNYSSTQDVLVCSSADMGAILIDAQAEGVWIEREGLLQESSLGLEILQATRLRISGTEIISCPGCGRTQYDLAGVVRQVKVRFEGRAGLKIAVMGCIVNGPGEMADADYGYIGGLQGTVTIYRGREIIARNIPEGEALDRLEYLINSEL